jgi:hypothetical protein
MKIQDTLKQILKEELSEEIKASEAYSDHNSIKTIVDGKRDVAFIKSSTYNYLMCKYYGLKVIKVPDSPNYIVYKKGAEDRANELLDIANKYGGFLHWQATDEDSRRIGQLLGYNQEDIEDYIKNSKKNKPED